MAIKRVGTGNPPPPVPHLFESRKHGGSAPELDKAEVLRQFKASQGYPYSGSPKLTVTETPKDE
jgi:hypothetical protein